MPELTIEQAMQIAVAHHQAGRLADAETIYRQVLAAQPNHPEAMHKLGVIAGQTGRYDQAVDLIGNAIAASPGNSDYCYNLALIHHKHGQLDQAIACYQQVIKIKPGFAEAYYNLGNAWKEKDQPDEALACYQRAVELKSNYAQARNNLGGALWEKGQVAQAVACYRKAWELNPKFISAHDNYLYALLFDPASDSQSLLIENQRWNRQHAQPLQRLIQPHLNDRNPDRRLRIGYVSPDFRKHPVGRSLLPVLLHHDPSSVEVVCYSTTVKPDVLTPRFKQCAAIWRDVQGLSDEQLAAQIRADQIDILVDLTLHMAGNRLLVFARKPAPVQVTWLGYPGTTGLETMDYRLTDPHMDPPGETDQFYTEKSIRLPDTFQCYDPLTAEIPVNELPASQAGYVTLGCLNNFAKFNEPLLETWASILKQSTGTRLLLKTNQQSAAQWARDIFSRHRLSPQRLEFTGDQPSHEDYLRLYHRIDLVLDPFPYNGHTTSMDATWMGVPVLSWCGKTAVSRAGLSQSSNVGMPELTAMSQADYVRLAVELAGDLPRLAELRRIMRPRMQASPLMDAPRFARGIESAFRTIWRNWCAKQKY